jgi:hypothetical protein
MTVYAKIENNKLITAYNGYNGVIGLADSTELCLVNGFTPYTEDEISGYYTGTHKIVDGVLTDITNTPEYIAKELAKAKEAKMQENATKRDEHLLAGVVYKDVLFDSDTDQKINLQFYVPNMSDTDTVIWFGKDNQPLKCTKEDLMAIGGLISSLTAQVWSVKNPAYVEAINNATTIEELNAINIDYN